MYEKLTLDFVRVNLAADTWFLSGREGWPVPAGQGSTTLRRRCSAAKCRQRRRSLQCLGIEIEIWYGILTHSFGGITWGYVSAMHVPPFVRSTAWGSHPLLGSVSAGARCGWVVDGLCDCARAEAYLKRWSGASRRPACLLRGWRRAACPLSGRTGGRDANWCADGMVAEIFITMAAAAGRGVRQHAHYLLTTQSVHLVQTCSYVNTDHAAMDRCAACQLPIIATHDFSIFNAFRIFGPLLQLIKFSVGCCIHRFMGS